MDQCKIAFAEVGGVILTGTSIVPLFIFSLPRSGSTLLQRILATSSEIATASESWLLLPLLYSLKKEGRYAEYNHHVQSNALEDFCSELPQGKGDYLEEVGLMARALYGKASKKCSSYFLDKTPRYHLIASDILDALPDCKSIFLWRNPLAVVASIIETFGKGKWVVYAYEIDLYRGLDNLINAYKTAGDTAFVVRYEDLITDPEQICKQISDYLDISYESRMIEGFSQTMLRGRYGDPSGTKFYMSLSSEPLERWKRVLATPLRKAWCRKYLEWIGEERLSIMGYDWDELNSELESIPVKPKKLVSDGLRRMYGVYYNMVNNVAGNHVSALLGRMINGE